MTEELSGSLKILLQVPTIIQSFSLFTILTSIITVGLTVLLQRFKENKIQKNIPQKTFNVRKVEKTLSLDRKERRYKKVPHFDIVM